MDKACIALQQCTFEHTCQTMNVSIEVVFCMQNAQQPSQIDCDAQLSAVFQAKSVKLASLSQRIGPHLRLVEPLQLRYTVR